MESRFELNIKNLSIKGDDTALFLFLNGNLLFKIKYRDFSTVVRFLVANAQQMEILPTHGNKLLDADHSEVE